jgi:acetyl-CoA carboxylase biotin carboxylase subunit
VLLKPAGGGGGKGMMLASTEEELTQAFDVSRQIASSAFANPELYIERWLPAVRHVEIQVLADDQGHAITVRERDCSVQRRHQKLIEETPSPGLPERTREGMQQAALRLVVSAGYTNAGTCEFLVDPDGAFYFLEMNTRLQVEHPVTEAVTKADLVREQLLIAAGEGLSLADPIHAEGAAIECRIIAEDPFREFSPAQGVITMLHEPGGPGIRVDSALYQGMEVTPYYDSLLAKLIAWAPDRSQALARMRRAVAEYRIGGIATNIPFHSALLEHRTFLEAGHTTTTYAEGFRTAQQTAAVS